MVWTLLIHSSAVVLVQSVPRPPGPGGHRDVWEVSCSAGPLSNVFWAAWVEKKNSLTIILSSLKVDVLNSSEI